MLFLNAFFQEALRNAIDSAIVRYPKSHFGLQTVEKVKQDYRKVAEL